MAISKVEIHPHSEKYILQNHPHITEDQYTQRFPKPEMFLLAAIKDRPIAIVLHDPNHKKIKGRVWVFPNDKNQDGTLHLSTYRQMNSQEKFLKYFTDDFYKRIQISFERRKNLIVSNQRENYYLVCGENDRIPGLSIQRFRNHFIFTFFTEFWVKFLKEQNYIHIKKLLCDLHKNPCENFDEQSIQFWIQERNQNQKIKIHNVFHPEIHHGETVVTEFGIHYQIKINSFYDYGLYTDMAAIRLKILKYLDSKDHYLRRKGLNLFSYTGAFSLFFLKNGFQNFISVDLSKQYLDWLKENIQLNPNLEIDEIQSTKNNILDQESNPQFKRRHLTIQDSVENALKKLQHEKFDLIICDPPSSSSDGKSRTNSLTFYEKELSSLLSLLSEEGILVIFLNTHRINRKKFEEKIHGLIESRPFKISQSFSLHDDMATLRQFPEGDYLKGLAIERTKNT